MRSRKHDTVIFGNFNTDTLVDSKSRSDYEKVLYAVDFKQQNFQPKGLPQQHPLVWIFLSQDSKRKQ